MSKKSPKPKTDENRKVRSTLDLAKYLGLSEWTVSRAINGHPEVKQSTRERVLAAMQELGFQPNPLARGLNGKSTGLIGICFGHPRSPLVVDKIASLDEFLHEKSYRGVLAISTQNPEAEKTILSDFRRMRVDGVILIQSYSQREDIDRWLGGLPAVHVDPVEPEIGPSVYFDRKQAMHLLVDHLYNLGHRTFGALGFSASNPWRWHGLVSALEDHKLDPAKCLRSFELPAPGLEAFADGIQLAEIVLSSKKPPTALLAVNDLVAVGASRHLVDCGFDIPGDFSMTGFDDLDVCQYVLPSITSINQSPRVSMRRAVEILLETIRNPSSGNEIATIDPVLRIRKSTGRPGSR